MLNICLNLTETMSTYKDSSVLIKNKNLNCNMRMTDMCKCNIEWNY